MKKFKLFLCGLFLCGAFIGNAVAADVNCGPGYGYDEENTECVKCEPGWYSPGGSAQCKKCGGGRYSSSAGSSGCSRCAPGTYAPVPVEDEDVNVICHPCPNGKYAEREGMSECEQCSGHSAPWVSPDKTKCEACPPGNCCYRYIAHICKKGTYSGDNGDLACRVASQEQQQVCSNRDGSVCVSGPVIKGGCTACPGGRTTTGLGAIFVEDCSVQSASVFRESGGSFSWPMDGSISEQDITSPYVSFSPIND